jgi:hypothetical protein
MLHRNFDLSHNQWTGNVEAGMSKVAGIDAAVRHHLRSDDDYSKVMGDGATNITGTLAAGYGYDYHGIQHFLLNVANHLKCDTPALLFDWRSLDPKHVSRVQSRHDDQPDRVHDRDSFLLMKLLCSPRGSVRHSPF